MLLNLYKQAYSGLSRNSWYLCLVMLVNRSGTMVLPFMTIYCTQKLHFSITQAGTIMALFGAGAITGAFIGGKITDRIGFYDLQIFALLSGGVLFIVLGFQQTFLSIAVLSYVLSLCNESFRPANSSAIAHYSTAENKTRSFSLNRLAVNLGWAFGGALGGFIAGINYHLLFWVDGCTNIVAAILLLNLIPRVNFVKPAIVDKALKKASSAYRDYPYLVFIALTVLLGSSFFQIFAMQPVFYKTQWHLTEQYIGLTMAVSGLIITFFEMVIIHNIEGKRHHLQYVSAGALIIGCGFMLQNLLPPGAALAMLVSVIVTLGEMMSMPFMNSFWIGRTTNFNRGEYGGLYTMAWSSAQILGPAIGSQVIGCWGFGTLWWLIGLLCCIVALAMQVLYRYLRLKEMQIHVLD